MNIIIKEIKNGYIITENTPDNDICVIEDNPDVKCEIPFNGAYCERRDSFKRMLEKICEIGEFEEGIKITIVKEK